MNYFKTKKWRHLVYEKVNVGLRVPAVAWEKKTREALPNLS